MTQTPSRNDTNPISIPLRENHMTQTPSRNDTNPISVPLRKKRLSRKKVTEQPN